MTYGISVKKDSETTNPRPKVNGYQGIKRLVRGQILSGRYQPNDKLPAEEQMSVELGTPRLTLHRALRELAAEGLLQRAARRGTVVSDPSKHVIGTVALLVPTPIEEYRMFVALGDALSSNGLALIPYNYQSDNARALNLAHYLARKPLTGAVVVLPLGMQKDVLQVFHKADVPVVVLGRLPSGLSPVSSVGWDDRGGGRLLARHLLSLGHRRFATIIASVTPENQERLSGFQEVIAQKCGPVPPENQFAVTPLEAISLLVQEILARPLDRRPQAIFGINSVVAAHVMLALHRQGLRVPDDMAVVGFGNPTLSCATISPMTTIEFPEETLGQMLASMLLNTVTGRITIPQTMTLDCTLIVRESCGAKR